MTIDYSGLSILIGAVVAAFGSIVTTILQWKAGKKIDSNKQEAIAARAEQTNTIIQSAVTPALNTDPSTLPQPVGAPHPATDPEIVKALTDTAAKQEGPS